MRKANVIEAGFRASLNLIDVPLAGQLWDKQTASSAILSYSKTKIEEHSALVSDPSRSLFRDDRVALVIYFINGLTCRSLSKVDISFLKEISKLTKVILVISKADCLLPVELENLTATVRVSFL